MIFLAERGVVETWPLSVRWDGDGQIIDRTPPDQTPRSVEHYFLPVVRDFLKAARTGQPAIITGSQMVQAQAAIDAIYESARLGREVRL
jgi:predicted dehydrogenase